MKIKRSGTTAPLWRTVKPQKRDRLFRSIEFMAHHGFHAKTIAEVSGCSVGNVYTALQKLQIHLRDYRDGKGPVGRQIVLEVKKTTMELVG